MTDNADQLAYWNKVAGPKWVANQVRLDRFMTPLTTALLEAAAPKPGETVIDVGCGCGDLALRLVTKVGPSGRVLGLDISGPMLAHARARGATLAPGASLDWVVADAMIHPLQPDHDLMTSRFGVMFFEDRTRAFANLRRALKPGSRFAFLTWRGRAEVEWMHAPLQWIEPVLPMPEDMDGAVGPFGLADGPATCDLFAAAGFSAVERQAVDRRLTIGTTVDDAWTMLADTGPAAASMRDAEPGQRSRAEALIREQLGRLLFNGRVELGGACWLYSGQA